MKAKIIDVGNSKGVRLPKSIIEQLGLKGEVELKATKDALIIRASHGARFDWAKAFHSMAKAGDDSLLDNDLTTDWDDKEWEWK